MYSDTERAIDRLKQGGISVRAAALEFGIAPSTLYRQIAKFEPNGAAPVQRLVIVGAGALGRELLGWFRNDGETGEIVFIDDVLREAGVSEFYASSPVVSMIDAYVSDERDSVLLAAADPAARQRIRERLDLTIPEYPTYSHRTVIRGNAVIGEGCLLFPHSLISADAALGRHCVVNTFCSIGHDVVIGEFCTLSSHVDLCGRVKVGDRVFIGSGARVLPDVTIGDDAKIGPGAVVLQDVPAGATVFGVPARQVMRGHLPREVAA